MLVRAIEQLGKGKALIIREDDSHVCLYNKEIKTLGFQTGEPCTEEQWATAVASAFKRGKKRVFYLLAKRDYTEHEILTKLSKEKYSDDQSEGILQYFRELGYIDDKTYVTKYYRCYKVTKSKRVIEQKLQAKGIARTCIKSVLEKENLEEDAHKAIRCLAIKKYGHKELSSVDFPKMVQFFLRKGFDFGLSKSIVDGLLSGEFDEDHP